MIAVTFHDEPGCVHIRPRDIDDLGLLIQAFTRLAQRELTRVALSDMPGVTMEGIQGLELSVVGDGGTARLIGEGTSVEWTCTPSD